MMSVEVEQIGSRLRDARRRRGWTLEHLSSLAGMSMSTLSRLESGKRQANLELLVPLTRQLGIRIDDLLPDEPDDPRVRRPAIRRNGLVIAPLTLENSSMRTFKITYPPRKSPRPTRVHDGYEWLYVLSGRINLTLGEKVIVLEAGDAAEFDTRVPHAISAGADMPAEVISIFNERGERMHTHTDLP